MSLMTIPLRSLPRLYDPADDAAFDEDGEPLDLADAATNPAAEPESYVRELAPSERAEVSSLRALFDEIVDELEDTRPFVRARS